MQNNDLLVVLCTPWSRVHAYVCALITQGERAPPQTKIIIVSTMSFYASSTLDSLSPR